MTETESDNPVKPLDCFTEEEKLKLVDTIKRELPDQWQRTVMRQAFNRERYEPTKEEQNEWHRDNLMIGRIIENMPFDFGNDGWETSRHTQLFQVVVEAALSESYVKFPKN